MNTLEKLEARLDIKNSEIIGIIKGKEIVIPVEFKRRKGNREEENKED